MEILRDLALAEYENLVDQKKVEFQDMFNEFVTNGHDFSEEFQSNIHYKFNGTAKLLSTYELTKKQSLDFEEFITLQYLINNTSCLIKCKGCSCLITAKPYFTCNECFFDFSNGQSFNLCCDCYRSKNFKDHQHTVFDSIHSMTLRCRETLVMKENSYMRRREGIDRALNDFDKDFHEFARYVAYDSFGWRTGSSGASLKLNKDENVDEISVGTNEGEASKGKKDGERNLAEEEGEMSDEKEEENPNMSRPHGASRYVDLLGVQPTEMAGLRIRNN